MAAAASAIIPGVGQLLNGRRRVGARLVLGSLAALALTLVIVRLVPPFELLAWAIQPAVLGLLLVANIGIAVVRLGSVLHAFADAHQPTRPDRLTFLGLMAVVVFVTAPHVLAWQAGSAAQSAFERIFEAGEEARGVSPAPGANERINVLLIGVDLAPQRNHALTDSMMVVSTDPVGKTVTLVSLPRDLVNVPLGNGDDFGPKLNSLRAYAAAHPKEFPQGGTRALQDAVGSLLGIEIHHHATMDLIGFQQLVDVVGGVDVVNTVTLADPVYDWLDGTYGYSLAEGPHHLDGRQALAYARSRYTPGDTDFGRAARQQEVLLAIRDRLAQGNVILRLPELFDALADLISTDIPVDQIPRFAALAAGVERDSVVRIVISRPLVAGKRTSLGSVQVPDVEAIRAMAVGAFSAPGTPPTPWPTPTPAPAQAGSPAP